MNELVQNKISGSCIDTTTNNSSVLVKFKGTEDSYFDFCSSHIRVAWYAFLKNTFEANINPKHFLSLIQAKGCRELDNVKELLAKCPDTPKEILELICIGSPESVLEAVAENPRATPQILTSLSRHNSSLVRLAVADHPDTPFQTILKLADDDCLDIPYRLAENPNLPVKILEWLCESENPYIQDRANRTMERITAC